MDIGSLIGLIVVYGLVLAAMITGAGVMIYVDLPSFLIVVGGVIAIAFESLPFSIVSSGAKAVLKFFFYTPTPPSELINQLVGFSVKARRDGILALESAEGEIKDEFLKKGIRMAVDGTDPEVIRSILETDMDATSQRHKQNLAFLAIFTDMGPAMGMIGTLIGLVAMLQSMDDPSAIGPSMAVALLTTLYGAMMSNMTSIPMTTRLNIRSGEEELCRQIMIAGIMSIQAGDNPRIVEQKLNAFIAPSQRKTQFE